MSGYSGRTTFTFEIERYRDKDTGDLFVGKSPSITDDDFEYEPELIEIEVTGTSYYSPGKYSGAPEDCYPDEGDTEIESVIGPDGKDWYHVLTEDEINYAVSLIEERVSSNDCGSYDDEPDYDDYYDPRWDNYDPYGK